MADKVLAEGKQLVDLGGGVWAEKVVAVNADGSAVGDAAATGAATATTSSVNDSATSVTLLAANALRKGATIYNDSPSALYLKLGATASATSFTALLAGNGSGVGGYFEVPAGYVGVIDGIWSADASGAARVVELT